MDIKEIAQRLAPGYWKRDQWNVGYLDSVGFAEALIEAYRAELLKEVGEPVYQVCKSDSISLSSAWIDVTEQTYNDAGLYHEYGRRILYTSDQVAAAIAKTTKPLETKLAKAEQRVAEACAKLVQSELALDSTLSRNLLKCIRQDKWRKFVKGGTD